MADLVLDLGRQCELPLERRRAQDPLALRQDSHQLGVPVHLDELDQLRPVVVRHPVVRLDLASALDVLEELFVAVHDELPATEKIRLALRSHLAVVAEQLDVATVFVQEWRYLEGDRRDEIVAERRRYEERIRALFREGRDLGELRTDLDDATAALLLLSAANWAYTWLQAGEDTDALADRFFGLLLDGMRGYATR